MRPQVHALAGASVTAGGINTHAAGYGTFSSGFKGVPAVHVAAAAAASAAAEALARASRIAAEAKLAARAAAAEAAAESSAAAGPHSLRAGAKDGVIMGASTLSAHQGGRSVMKGDRGAVPAAAAQSFDGAIAAAAVPCRPAATGPAPLIAFAVMPAAAAAADATPAGSPGRHLSTAAAGAAAGATLQQLLQAASASLIGPPACATGSNNAGTAGCSPHRAGAAAAAATAAPAPASRVESQGIPAPSTQAHSRRGATADAESLLASGDADADELEGLTGSWLGREAVSSTPGAGQQGPWRRSHEMPNGSDPAGNESRWRGAVADSWGGGCKESEEEEEEEEDAAYRAAGTEDQEAPPVGQQGKGRPALLAAGGEPTLRTPGVLTAAAAAADTPAQAADNGGAVAQGGAPAADAAAGGGSLCSLAFSSAEAAETSSLMLTSQNHAAAGGGADGARAAGGSGLAGAAAEATFTPSMDAFGLVTGGSWVSPFEPPPSALHRGQPAAAAGGVPITTAQPGSGARAKAKAAARRGDSFGCLDLEAAGGLPDDKPRTPPAAAAPGSPAAAALSAAAWARDGSSRASTRALSPHATHAPQAGGVPHTTGGQPARRQDASDAAAGVSTRPALAGPPRARPRPSSLPPLSLPMPSYHGDGGSAFGAELSPSSAPESVSGAATPAHTGLDTMPYSPLPSHLRSMSQDHSPAGAGLLLLDSSAASPGLLPQPQTQTQTQTQTQQRRMVQEQRPLSGQQRQQQQSASRCEAVQQASAASGPTAAAGSGARNRGGSSSSPQVGLGGGDGGVGALMAFDAPPGSQRSLSQVDSPLVTAAAHELRRPGLIPAGHTPLQFVQCQGHVISGRPQQHQQQQEGDIRHIQQQQPQGRQTHRQQQQQQQQQEQRNSVLLEALTTSTWGSLLLLAPSAAGIRRHGRDTPVAATSASLRRSYTAALLGSSPGGAVPMAYPPPHVRKPSFRAPRDVEGASPPAAAYGSVAELLPTASATHTQLASSELAGRTAGASSPPQQHLARSALSAALTTGAQSGCGLASPDTHSPIVFAAAASTAAHRHATAAAADRNSCGGAHGSHNVLRSAGGNSNAAAGSKAGQGANTGAGAGGLSDRSLLQPAAGRDVAAAPAIAAPHASNNATPSSISAGGRARGLTGRVTGLLQRAFTRRSVCSAYGGQELSSGDAAGLSSSGAVMTHPDESTACDSPATGAHAAAAAQQVPLSSRVGGDVAAAAAAAAGGMRSAMPVFIRRSRQQQQQQPGEVLGRSLPGRHAGGGRPGGTLGGGGPAGKQWGRTASAFRSEDGSVGLLGGSINGSVASGGTSTTFRFATSARRGVGPGGGDGTQLSPPAAASHPPPQQQPHQQQQQQHDSFSIQLLKVINTPLMMSRQMSRASHNSLSHAAEPHQDGSASLPTAAAAAAAAAAATGGLMKSGGVKFATASGAAAAADVPRHGGVVMLGAVGAAAGSGGSSACLLPQPRGSSPLLRSGGGAGAGGGPSPGWFRECSSEAFSSFLIGTAVSNNGAAGQSRQLSPVLGSPIGAGSYNAGGTQRGVLPRMLQLASKVSAIPSAAAVVGSGGVGSRGQQHYALSHQQLQQQRTGRGTSCGGSGTGRLVEELQSMRVPLGPLGPLGPPHAALRATDSGTNGSKRLLQLALGSGEVAAAAGGDEPMPPAADTNLLLPADLLTKPLPPPVAAGSAEASSAGGVGSLLRGSQQAAPRFSSLSMGGGCGEAAAGAAATAVAAAAAGGDDGGLQAVGRVPLRFERPSASSAAAVVQTQHGAQPPQASIRAGSAAAAAALARTDTAGTLATTMRDDDATSQMAMSAGVRGDIGNASGATSISTGGRGRGSRWLERWGLRHAPRSSKQQQRSHPDHSDPVARASSSAGGGGASSNPDGSHAWLPADVLAPVSVPRLTLTKLLNAATGSGSAAAGVAGVARMGHSHGLSQSRAFSSAARDAPLLSLSGADDSTAASAALAALEEPSPSQHLYMPHASAAPPLLLSPPPAETACGFAPGAGGAATLKRHAPGWEGVNADSSGGAGNNAVSRGNAHDATASGDCTAVAQRANAFLLGHETAGTNDSAYIPHQSEFASRGPLGLQQHQQPTVAADSPRWQQQQTGSGGTGASGCCCWVHSGARCSGHRASNALPLITDSHLHLQQHQQQLAHPLPLHQQDRDHRAQAAPSLPPPRQQQHRQVGTQPRTQEAAQTQQPSLGMRCATGNEILQLRELEEDEEEEEEAADSGADEQAMLGPGTEIAAGDTCGGAGGSSGGGGLLKLPQHDVSARVWAEQQLARVMEAEHALLEAIFPAHVLEHIAIMAAAAAGGAGAGLPGAVGEPPASDAHDGGGPPSPQLPLHPDAGESGSHHGGSLFLQQQRQARARSLQGVMAAANLAAAAAGLCPPPLMPAPPVRVPQSPSVRTSQAFGLASGRPAGVGGPGCAFFSGGGGAPAPLPITGETFLHLSTSHTSLTVLFCDIQGFTAMCNMVKPATVMAFLNDLFTRLDALLDAFGVYKVETIGDCYMVAGGLMKVDEDTGAVTVRSDDVDPLHAYRTVQFAKALLRAVGSVRLPTTGEPVRLRVGIHSGPAMSGVVGTRMPRFCLFGDTVNTASRMESTGEAGAIHVSKAVFDLVPGEAWQATGGVQEGSWYGGRIRMNGEHFVRWR
ncbi:hypothetical protein HYH02_002047 [Chlamydomonas schloesseri]|uniref:Guanylate cyclase domain-containing protein n=1 Tax=Chlamydomonas schloesseri TaxID=2026947 RepID=A0A835WWT6_9CHLO|nr:hypothetical protein HYH02_002047 [Chlamydomonas schloesseri]|eukprot:KAG2453840.1 hypothetical protein HYH02_002047 [Chlamydomonas schloesseri]